MATTLTYFSLLGLSEDAGPDEIETRYQALADYFASPGVPASLREWANRQAALVDEAYAVLADPERRAGARQAALPPSETPRLEPAAAAPEVARRESGRQPDTPGDRRREPAPGGFGLLRTLASRPLVLGALVGMVVLAAVLISIYGLPGRGGGDGAPAAAQGSIVPLDNKRVTELMATVQQDPKNKDALFELGERYFDATEWRTSIDWLSRLILVDPSNLFAMTDIGTANFNLGKPDVAKTIWLQVLDIDPNYVQAHYNLGFFYANVEPQDLDAARREWGIVVQLAPDSDLASTVQVHLSGLLAGTPTAGVAGTTPSP